MSTTLNIEVRLSERAYTIRIQPGVLDQAGTVLEELALKGPATIITDTRVGPLYADRVLDCIGRDRAAVVQFPEGEQNKNLDTVRNLYDRLLDLNRARDSFVIALGGGVVGDIAGFVAATFLRGVPFIQIPTSLLAQVDSSIGGKVGVDLPQGKNLVGAFYQPGTVLLDPEVLKTLEKRHLINGMVEVFKHGVILHDRLFDYLEENLDKMMALDMDTLVEVIGRSCRIKTDVVEQDERESGIRAILNFGHTVGHAIETCNEYEGWLHGEAVAVGMLVETRIAQKMGLTADGTFQRQQRLYSRAGLPVVIPKLDKEKFQNAIFHDKKNLGSKIRMILPLEIGKVEIVNDVPFETIWQTTSEMMK